MSFNKIHVFSCAGVPVIRPVAPSVVLNLPILTSPPSIEASGELGEGAVLTATAGVWTDADTVTGAWQVAPAANPASFADIPGATGLTYDLVAPLNEGDVYRYLETATNTDGTTYGDSNTITLTGPQNTAAPYYSDAAMYSGETLTCDDGTWTGLGNVYSYQWLRDGVEIAGATVSSYLLTLDDVGFFMSCRVFATNAIGSYAQESNIAGPVIASGAPAPVNSAAPTISYLQNPYEGDIRVNFYGSWDPSPDAFYYQWYLNGSPVSGQVTDVYYLTSSLVAGDDLYCEVIAGNAGSNSTPAASNTIADFVVPASATIYWTDVSDNEDAFVIQWGTDNIDFPNEIIFPQPYGGFETGPREYECLFPGAGTYYARIIARNYTSGDSEPGATVTLTAV